MSPFLFPFFLVVYRVTPFPSAVEPRQTPGFSQVKQALVDRMLFRKLRVLLPEPLHQVIEVCGVRQFVHRPPGFLVGLNELLIFRGQRRRFPDGFRGHGENLLQGAERCSPCRPVHVRKKVSRAYRPNNRPANRAICVFATTDALRPPTTAQASPRGAPPHRAVSSATCAGRARTPAKGTACVSRLGLAHYLRRSHGPALSRGELPAGLRHGGGYTLPTTFGEAAAQTATNSA